jgi:syntaxin 16
MVHTRRLMIRFDDAEDQHEREIDKLNGEVAALFQRADSSLKKITRPFVGGQPSVSSADRLVRLNTQRSLASRLQQISVQFRQRQREYLHRLQLQKFGSDTFGFDPDDDTLPINTPHAQSSQADLEIEMQRFKIESRDAEIQRIARSVGALATIFKEVAEMVIDQGTVIDRIDYNMEQVWLLRLV